MKRLRLLSGILLLWGLLCGCQATPGDDDHSRMEAGVSRALAEFRKAAYQEVAYSLAFEIPAEREKAVMGEVTIYFELSEPAPLILDFRARAEQITEVSLNGKEVPFAFLNEHIRIEPEWVESGQVSVYVQFTVDEQSLNRREDYLYTLLVPDRARTLFPCFDQPDLKAPFQLSLVTPADWQAVGNAPLATRHESLATIQYSFLPCEPISTYLFSFVAGKMERETYQRGERAIALYHRETDPLKVAQCPAIADEVFDALEWMEKYTAVPYPFAKYDLIILPGFQYGGMEHTGATLYNDRRMFLNAQPTLNEQLSRSALIAHETAHMWFGDYVTMQWFDDVWTKEIFANYFASRMVEPLYPEVNHRLNFIRDYYPSAYSEDRTAGANPIKQELQNLSDAGLVYGQIIYNKSPIVLEMLVEKIGEKAFQEGIQTYLSTYAYGNASWENLIAIWDQLTADDLTAWSRFWVEEKGMPVIDTPAGEIPPTDGRGYGFYRLTADQADQCFSLLRTSSDEVEKGALLIHLYENLMNATVDAEVFRDELLSFIAAEDNSLLYSMAMGYVFAAHRYARLSAEAMENALWAIVTTNKNAAHRLQALRAYFSIAEKPEAVDRLYMLWKEQRAPQGCALSENDYISLSYTLAVLLPEKAEEIGRLQRERISNPDRLEAFTFIFPSVSADQAVRDSVFTSLLEPENRRIEPWAASALANLNHAKRQREALKYIRPALEELEEVQKTGDIFFPTNWLRALLAGHLSVEAQKEVDQFFLDHPDYHPMLTNKIKQQSDALYRFAR